MTAHSKPTPAEIRLARSEHPKMRERDLAASLGISEAELVAAHCGYGAARIEPHFEKSFPALAGAGEVMALTRNEGAVHEKIGVYDSFHNNPHAAMMLGAQIDLRMFPRHWAHAFAVEKNAEDGIRRSLQFFNVAGDAIHKIHARPATDLQVWRQLVESITLADQSDRLDTTPLPKADVIADAQIPVPELRQRWAAMTDTHQFALLLRALKLSRPGALAAVGDDYAWPVQNDAAAAMMERSAAEELPIMCFVGSSGCIQIHSGPIRNLKRMGPWLNVMDEDFHLHLRTDHIVSSWAVRKPTDKGHVTSLECFGADGGLIIQFFGKRIEGQDERRGWRDIVESLPRAGRPRAA